MMDKKEFDLGPVSGIVYCADAIDLLEDIGTEVADLIFLDPPFNLGKRYSNQPKFDRIPDKEYKEWLVNIVDMSLKALKPGGAMFIYHLPIWALRIGAYVEDQLSFRHWITVSMKNSFVRGDRLYPAHYALLYFSKGSPQHFFRPKLEPLRCRDCGSLVRDYGGYRKIVEQSGINLSDIWDDLSPVRHRNRKHRSANELPIALFERIMTISAKSGMMYVDPFAGSGSGAIAAVTQGLNFVVGDILHENTDIICSRLADAFPT